MDKGNCMYIMKYYSVIKNEILSFVATWIGSGHYIKWNESNRERPILPYMWNIYYFHHESKKIKQWIKQKGSRYTDIENKLTVTNREGRDEGQYSDMGSIKGYYGIMWNLVWNFENYNEL